VTMDTHNQCNKRTKLEQLVYNIRKLVCRDTIDDEEEQKLNVASVEDDIESIQDNLAKRCISQDFISEMREAFHLFDKDGSGFICSKEMGPLLRVLGWNPTEAEVNRMIAEVDVDHNGKMDLMEFIMMMHNQVGNTDTMEEMKMAFRAFDTDGDGKVSKEEFRLCMLNFGERFCEDEIAEMVKQADTDDDGSIDFTEFVYMITHENLEQQTHSKLVTFASRGVDWTEAAAGEEGGKLVT